MSKSDNKTLEQRFKFPIILVSIVIPVVVAVLFSVKLKDFGIEVETTYFPTSYLCRYKRTYCSIAGNGCNCHQKRKPKSARKIDDNRDCLFCNVFGHVCCLSHDF